MISLCIPDSRTKSFESSPWLLKSLRRVVKLLNGDGMLAFASDTFEITPSLRPVGTFQNGPPCLQPNELQLETATLSVMKSR